MLEQLLNIIMDVDHAAAEKEVVKMIKNGPKCEEPGWEVHPPGCGNVWWLGEVAREIFQHTSRRIAAGIAVCYDIFPL